MASKEISASGSLEAVGSAPVFDLTLRSSSGAITDFRGGYATVSLPYTLAAGQNPSGVVVYYLDGYFAGNYGRLVFPGI